MLSYPPGNAGMRLSIFCIELCFVILFRLRSSLAAWGGLLLFCDGV